MGINDVIGRFIAILDSTTLCAFPYNHHVWLVNEAKLHSTEEHILTISARHLCNANQQKKWMSNLTYLYVIFFKFIG
jgi:hypothetical protein